MNNQNDYNDNKKITYHEQTDISNILKLNSSGYFTLSLSVNRYS